MKTDGTTIGDVTRRTTIYTTSGTMNPRSPTAPGGSTRNWLTATKLVLVIRLEADEAHAAFVLAVGARDVDAAHDLVVQLLVDRDDVPARL